MRYRRITLCSSIPIRILIILVFPYTSSSFQSITSVQHGHHTTGSKYFGFDQEHVEDFIDERKCLDLQSGHTAFDATHSVRDARFLHECQESHEVPVQQDCIDHDMNVESKGQNAYDAAQEHGHVCGDGGSSWNGEQINCVFLKRET